MKVNLGAAIEAGAELDLVSGDELDQAVRRIRREGLRRMKLYESAEVPAANVVALDLGEVPAGEVWELVQLAVFLPGDMGSSSGTVTTFANGDVTVFVGAVSPGSVVDVTPDVLLPVAAFYSRREIILHPGEHLIVRVNVAQATWPQAGVIATVLAAGGEEAL